MGACAHENTYGQTDGQTEADGTAQSGQTEADAWSHFPSDEWRRRIPRSSLPSEAGQSAQPGARDQPPYLRVGGRSVTTPRGPRAHWPARLAANRPAHELPDVGRRSGGLPGKVGFRPCLLCPCPAWLTRFGWTSGCCAPLALPTARQLHGFIAAAQQAAPLAPPRAPDAQPPTRPARAPACPSGAGADAPAGAGRALAAAGGAADPWSKARGEGAAVAR